MKKSKSEKKTYPSVRTPEGKGILDCIDMLRYLGYKEKTITLIICSKISEGKLTYLSGS